MCSLCWLPLSWSAFIELLFFAARERDDSVSSTYDTIITDKVQQRVRAGSVAVDDTLKQKVQKRIDVNQQVGLSHTVTTLMLDEKLINVIKLEPSVPNTQNN